MYSATTNVLNLFLKIILKYCIYNVHVGVSDLRQVRSVVSPGTPGTTNKKLTAMIYPNPVSYNMFLMLFEVQSSQFNISATFHGMIAC